MLLAAYVPRQMNRRNNAAVGSDSDDGGWSRRQDRDQPGRIIPARATDDILLAVNLRGFRLME